MPYPTEHSCRLADPNQFQRFARKNGEQEHDGKKIDVIYGVKDGKSQIQALRYDKEKWTEDSARSHCESRKGSFEAATKESDMTKDLQSKYSTLVQEYGRKNAFPDAKRIHDIMKLCQELLDPIEEELDAERKKEQEKKATEAMKEVEACLALLKEEKAMKTEDGVQFPSDAYAYVPDPDKPSEWKLRLWEDPQKKVTRKQLGAAAAALSPGGFRGQRVDIPRDDLSAVKRKIRAAYRSVDVPEDEMPKWVQESQSRELLAEIIPLGEAKIGNKGIAQLVVIQPGFNANKERYYPADVLARDCSVFEGAKMFADHATESEEKDRPERSIKDWVATLKNVKVDESGKIIGEAVVIEPWMQEKLAQLRDKGLLHELGVSINAVGTAIRSTIEGIKTNYIEKLNRVRSVDFVTWPGAGGMVTLYETDKEHDVDLVNLDSLRERRPDLVKQIESAVKAEIQGEVKRKMELEDKVKELEATITTLTAERDELKVQITEAERAKKAAEVKSVIDEAISKSNLPEIAKKRLADRFKDALSAEGITEAIKGETDYIRELAEAGKVKSLGGSEPNPEKDKATLRESFRRMHPEWTENQLEIAVTGR